MLLHHNIYILPAPIITTGCWERRSLSLCQPVPASWSRCCYTSSRTSATSKAPRLLASRNRRACMSCSATTRPITKRITPPTTGNHCHHAHSFVNAALHATRLSAKPAAYAAFFSDKSTVATSATSFARASGAIAQPPIPLTTCSTTCDAYAAGSTTAAAVAACVTGWGGAGLAGLVSALGSSSSSSGTRSARSGR